jgi:hypothetical protein
MGLLWKERTVAWCAYFFAILRNVFSLWASKDTFRGPEVNACKELRQLKKVPFYSHIEPDQIPLYQGYIDRAFEMSPTLEFEQDDPRLHELLAEALSTDSLSELDLELMRLQYLYADQHLRRGHRTNWVEKVVYRRDVDFFPDPWTIVSAAFAKYELTACLLREADSKIGPVM